VEKFLRTEYAFRKKFDQPNNETKLDCTQKLNQISKYFQIEILNDRNIETWKMLNRKIKPIEKCDRNRLSLHECMYSSNKLFFVEGKVMNDTEYHRYREHLTNMI
jgi:hypothetical protein